MWCGASSEQSVRSIRQFRVAGGQVVLTAAGALVLDVEWPRNIRHHRWEQHHAAGHCTHLGGSNTRHSAGDQSCTRRSSSPHCSSSGQQAAHRSRARWLGREQSQQQLWTTGDDHHGQTSRSIASAHARLVLSITGAWLTQSGSQSRHMSCQRTQQHRAQELRSGSIWCPLARARRYTIPQCRCRDQDPSRWGAGSHQQITWQSWQCWRGGWQWCSGAHSWSGHVNHSTTWATREEATVGYAHQHLTGTAGGDQCPQSRHFRITWRRPTHEE